MRGIYFPGDAPGVGPSAFAGAANVTAYYLAGTTGWGTTFGGIQAVLYDPLVPFTYTTNNGTITITGYTGLGGAVTIPDSINGVPVTGIGIGVSAFAYCQSLTSVSINTNVTSVGDYAFVNCYDLTSIAIPNSVGSIGSYAFSYCTRLTDVSLSENITSLASGAFSGCYSLVNVRIPNNVTNIQNAAFAFCENLTSITIGTNIATIEGNAFYACGSLTGVFFRGNAPDVNASAFFNAYNSIFYYLPGTTGWPTTFSDRPTALWRPQVHTSDGTFGVRKNQSDSKSIGLAAKSS